MSASGLSRRRGGGGGTAMNDPADSTAASSKPSTPTPNSLASTATSAATTSNTANHKIAFDQRDMQSGEEKIMPKLTLMEEVLLLGLKDKQVR